VDVGWFDKNEVQELARLQSTRWTEESLDWLSREFRGQPFLTHVLLSRPAPDLDGAGASLEEACQFEGQFGAYCQSLRYAFDDLHQAHEEESRSEESLREVAERLYRNEPVDDRTKAFRLLKQLHLLDQDGRPFDSSFFRCLIARLTEKPVP